ncbi:MAG TPA: heavy metal-associated domain-containing protein [Flavobacterium sp.]|nr:heavy metal-associated domain-containing protein [Flavobacterium sp.]
MDFSKSLLALALSGLLFVSCKNETKATEGGPAGTAGASKSVAENLQTASFSIEGMSCAVGCAKTIEKKLAGLDGVKEAKVDFDKKTATVAYDPAKQTPETFVETVEDAADGKTYKVSNLKSSSDKAMLFQEKNKTAKKTEAKTEKPKEAKPACCSGKKSCSADEKKAKSA